MGSGIEIRNSVLAGCPTDFHSEQGTGSLLQAWYNTNAFENEVYAEVGELQLLAPFNYSQPDFRPSGNSALNSGADFSNTFLQLDPFIQEVPYRGAFGNDD